MADHSGMKNDICHAIDDLYTVAAEMRSYSEKIRERQDTDFVYHQLCQLVDQARQKLQIIVCNADLLR